MDLDERRPKRQLPVGSYYDSVLEPLPFYSRNDKVVKEAKLHWRDGKVPDVSWFHNVIAKSLLWKVGMSSAPGVLAIAQLRQVSDEGTLRRAEAIMSAVGAILWYNEFINEPNG